MKILNVLAAYFLKHPLKIGSNNKLQFRDTGIFIHSTADGKLLISSDGAGTDAITFTGKTTHTNDTVFSGDITKDVALTATFAELNRSCDLTGRVVTIVETGAITVADHSDKICMLGEVGGNALVTLTLPEATGSGAKFKVIVSVLNTSSYVLVVADTTNANFIGNVINQDADLVGTIAAIIYLAGANADTITLNGTSTGGQKGDFIELVDVATDVWAVNGVVSCPAGSNTATPFSAAV
jgi:hypothetical protein